jgi:glycosyltransferase involved in cell wall biosynthesis
LRIVFLTQYYFKGGTYFRWHNLAINLKKLGHEIEILSCDTNFKSKRRIEIVDEIKYSIIPGCRFNRFFGNGSSNLFTTIKMLFVKLPDADIYHLFQPFPVMGFKWIFEKYTRKSSKFYYDWDDLWIGGIMVGKQNLINYHLVSFFENRLPKMADGVTTCSSYLKERVLEKRYKKVGIIHNGSNTVKIVDKRKARKLLGLDEHVQYIGFMGRTLNELKWCIEIINKTENKNIKLALCGMNKEYVNTMMKSQTLDKIDILGELKPSEAILFANSLDYGLLPLDENDFNKSRFPIKFADYQFGGANVFYSNIGDLKIYTNDLNWNIPLQPGNENFINGVIQYLDTNKHEKKSIDFSQLTRKLSWESKTSELISFYES